MSLSLSKFEDVNLKGYTADTSDNDSNKTAEEVSTVATYTVTFDGGGASGTAPKPITRNIGQKITIPDSGSLSNSDDFFDDWKAVDTDEVYVPGETAAFSESVTLTAQWVTLMGEGEL